MPFNCQYCSKSLKTKKSLKRHEAETCPDRPGATKPISPGEVQTLELKELKGKEKDKPGEGGGFHCIGCGAIIKKGENPCHGCGAELDWSALE